jgi:hypothetical protein
MVPKEPESQRPDIPELIRRAEESAAKADAARERRVKAHRAGAAIEERLARLADHDGRPKTAAEHRQAAAQQRATANQLGAEQTP